MGAGLATRDLRTRAPHATSDTRAELERWTATGRREQRESRLLARLNNLPLDDGRLLEVAIATGADVPVCLASQACDMTGVGEKLMPLVPPKMPSVLVNLRVPVGTREVFEALGLRHGELLIGAADVMIQASSWPEHGGSRR